MSNAIDNIRPFLALIKRSPDVGDGWRKVSPMLRKLIELRVAEAPDLYETKDEAGGLFIRATEEAAILGKYI